MLKKFMKSQKNCLYDVSWGPVSLLLMGAPIFLVVLVIKGIILVAIVLINKACKQKAAIPKQQEKQKENQQNNNL